MKRPLRISLALTIAIPMALGLAAAPALAKKPAAKKAACWKVLINDWYDGTINGRYPVSCYRSALRHIRASPDLRGYTSAYEEINAALQRRLVDIANQKKKRSTGKPTVVAPGKSGGNEGTATPPAASGGGPRNGGTSGGGSPAPVAPQSSSRPGKSPASHRGGKTPPQTKPVTHSGVSPSPVSPAPNPGESAERSATDGSRSKQIARVLGPKDATSVPVPLLVLAGVALLLMAAGAAGLLARRTQGKRVPVAVRPAPPARGN